MGIKIMPMTQGGDRSTEGKFFKSVVGFGVAALAAVQVFAPVIAEGGPSLVAQVAAISLGCAVGAVLAFRA
jgi:hypothetical protein